MLKMPKKVNVLLIGGGGREHAIAKSIKDSGRIGRLWTTQPANTAHSALARPLPFQFNVRELYRIKQHCQHEDVHFIIVGPEGPLAAGIADELSSPDCVVFGPSQSACRLESDKVWARQLMRSVSIPMAEGQVFRRWLQEGETLEEHPAFEFLSAKETPQVIKPSGLTGGKGVRLPESLDEATSTLQELLAIAREHPMGDEIIIEERLNGREVSVFALIDGRNIMILDACQDYKRLEDSDTGPNTGGMGAISPVDSVDGRTMEQIQRQIIIPAIDALRREGVEYRGVLYCGLMITHAGPRVLEFNVRFGDPELQAMLPRVQGDFLELLYATATGQLAEVEIDWSPNHTCCIVLASAGYPGTPQTGQTIVGTEEARAIEGVTIYEAGTKHIGTGEIRVSGGRVLSVVGQGATADEARSRAMEACERIHFDGKVMRSDIGAVGTPA